MTLVANNTTTMTVSSVYTPGPNAEDITIEKDGGILKEILVRISPFIIYFTLSNKFP